MFCCIYEEGSLLVLTLKVYTTSFEIKINRERTHTSNAELECLGLCFRPFLEVNVFREINKNYCSLIYLYSVLIFPFRILIDKSMIILIIIFLGYSLLLTQSLTKYS